MGNKSKQSKSAKDVAFDRERTILNSIIRQRDEEIRILSAELCKCKNEAESWKMTAEILEGYIGIPKEEILANIERGKKISGVLDPMMKVINSCK